jgi:hypothetical protein
VSDGGGVGPQPLVDGELQRIGKHSDGIGTRQIGCPELGRERCAGGTGPHFRLGRFVSDFRQVGDTAYMPTMGLLKALSSNRERLIRPAQFRRS